jgi:hypothetical protein
MAKQNSSSKNRESMLIRSKIKLARSQNRKGKQGGHGGDRHSQEYKRSPSASGKSYMVLFPAFLFTNLPFFFSTSNGCVNNKWKCSRMDMWS